MASTEAQAKPSEWPSLLKKNPVVSSPGLTDRLDWGCWEGGHCCLAYWKRLVWQSPDPDCFTGCLVCGLVCACVRHSRHMCGGEGGINSRTHTHVQNIHTHASTHTHANTHTNTHSREKRADGGLWLMGLPQSTTYFSDIYFGWPLSRILRALYTKPTYLHH